ncbi:Sterile alpha motif [Hirschfeldia incana]|nr:Sterile alpha motif [Hirschfeldia incana]
MFTSGFLTSMSNKVKQEASRSFQEMAELQPGNNDSNQQPNGGVPLSLPSTSAEAHAGSKRLRRPSVRLGEIGGGDQYQAAAYESQVRRPRKDTSKSSTRTRALTNLSSGYDNSEEREANVDSFGVGSWRVKKRVGPSSSTKRVRSNWVSRIGDVTDQELEGGFRDFSREDSESPVKDESLVRDGGGGFYGSSGGNREFEMLSEPEGIVGGGREGVKIWLQELGLGRYWPMFEIHEVDEEVLPLLTLEDLKDMGINAVGSRRKMFCAIQKLGREFS